MASANSATLACEVQLLVFGEHIRESGGVCEQVSECDGAERSTAEVGAKGAQVFVEPELSLCSELYGEQ